MTYVCKPLHYSTIMTRRTCDWMATVSWISGTFICSVDNVFILHLPFQRQNVIHHYFCESPAFLILASIDTDDAEMALLSRGAIILLALVSLILVSNWHIIFTVIRMQSRCSLPVTPISLLWFSTMTLEYLPTLDPLPKQLMNKVIPVFYSIMTSMLNPIICSLKNKNVKVTLRKLSGK